MTGGNNQEIVDTTEKPKPEKEPEQKPEKKPADNNDSEDEYVYYILESVSFTDAEIKAAKAKKEAEQYKSVLEEGTGSFGIGRIGINPAAANAIAPLSLDAQAETENDTEANALEKKEDTTGYMIEKHIDVDDGIEDINLPEKLVIKLRAADEDSTASKSDAKASDSNAKDDRSKSNTGKIRTLTVDIPEDSWLIMSPEDKAGAPIAELDTSGVELLDENGEPTGEFSTEQANYPQYILVPDIDNIDIEGSLSEDGSETGFIDMDQMLTKSNTATLEDYLLKNTAVRLSVGTRANDTLNENGEAEIALNIVSYGDDKSGNYYSYDASTNILILKKGNDPTTTKFKLYIDTSVPEDRYENFVKAIVFDESLLGSDVELTIEANDIVGAITFNNDSGSDSIIDLENINELKLHTKGKISFAGSFGKPVLNVPASKTLEINAEGTLTISPRANTVGIGSQSEAMGTVNISGKVYILAGDSIGIGVYGAQSVVGGQLNVNSGIVDISGGRSQVNTFPIQGINVMVGNVENCEFFVHSTNINDNNTVQINTEDSFFLTGYFDSKETQSGEVTVTLSKDDETFEKDLTLLVSDRYFMTNVPSEGTYIIKGTYNGRECGYVGKDPDITETDVVTGEFVVPETGISKLYQDIRHTMLPMFWDNEAELSGELTESGGLSVILSAAVDIEEPRNEIEGGYLVGDEKKKAYGFYIYPQTKDGHIDTTKYAVFYANNDGIDIENEHGGGYYSVTVATNTETDDGNVWFEPGKTYYSIPFVETEAGIRIADKYYCGGYPDDTEDPDIGEGNWDYVDEVKKPEIEITIPVINFPTSIEFTYGTTTAAAFNKALNRFDTIAGNNPSGDNITIDNVKFTFGDQHTTESIWGTNVEGASFRLSKPDGAREAGDWSGVTVTVPKGNEDNTYPSYEGIGDPDEYFVIEFVAPEKEEDGKLHYSNIKKPVKVTVNPKNITLISIGSSAIKDYDETDSIIWQDDSIVEFNGIETPYVYTEDGPENGTKDKVGIVIDESLKDPNAASGTYQDANADDEKTINITNIHLTGEDAYNYTTAKRTTLNNGVIRGMQIVLKPVDYKLRTGDKLTAASNSGKLEVEAVSPKDFDVSKLSLDDPDFDTSNINVDKYGHINETGPYPKYKNITLKVEQLNNKNPNYNISNAEVGGTYTVIQESPKLNGTSHGAYTVRPAESSMVNGWYRQDVTFEPKTNVESGEKNYYDTIRNAYTGEELREESSRDDYAEKFSIDSTTEVNIQLRNKENGGYTSIEQPSNTYYVDVDDPTISNISYDYADDDSLFEEALRLLGFGSFANGDVRVTVSANDQTSGIWKIEIITSDASGEGLPSTDIEPKTKYFSSEKAPEPSTIVNDLSKYQKGTVDFTIPDGFNGHIAIKLYDHAGRTSEPIALGQNSDGSWIVTDEDPDITGMQITGSNKAVGSVTWYNLENDTETYPVFSANIKDTASTQLTGRLGLAEASIVINDGVENPVEGVSNSNLVPDVTATYTLTAKDQDADGKITVNAVNNPGNSMSGSFTYYFDGEDPVIDDKKITYWTEDGNLIKGVKNFLTYGQFFTHAIKVKIPVSDELSGPESIHYAVLDENTEATKTAIKEKDLVSKSINQDEDGNKAITIDLSVGTKGYIYYYAEDVAGNTSDVYILKVDEENKIWVIESTKPDIVVKYNYKDGSKASPVQVETGGFTELWYTKPVTVTAEITDMPEDSYSGLKSVTYKFGYNHEETKTLIADDASPIDIEDIKKIRTASVSQIIADEGKGFDIEVSAIDNVGLTATADEDPINVDLKPPTIKELSLSNAVESPANGADFTNQSIVIGFKAEDPWSGVKEVSITRTKDGLGQAVSEDPVVLDPEDGETGLYNYTVDKNGTYVITAVDNVGHSYSVDFTVGNIDKNAPKDISYEILSDQVDGIYKDENLSIQIKGIDPVKDADYAQSKIKSIELYNTYNASASDGDLIWKKSFDKPYDWNLAPTNLNDIYDEDGEEQQPFSIEFHSGTYKLKLVITDFAGNSEIIESEDTITVSNSVPFAEITEVTAKDGEDELILQSSDITGSEIKWIKADSVTIDFIVRSDDGGDVSLYRSNSSQTPFDETGRIESPADDNSFRDTIHGPGITHVYYAAYHGGSTYWQRNPIEVTVRLDNKAPEAPGITINGQGTDDNYFEQCPEIVITPGNQEQDTAPETTYFKLWKGELSEEPHDYSSDKDLYKKYEEGISYPSVAESGTYTIKVYTEDEAGNKSGPNDKTFNVDVLPPVIEEVLVTPENSIFENIHILGGWFSKDQLTVKVTVTDNFSGASKLIYSIDQAENVDSDDGGDIELEPDAESTDKLKYFIFTIDPKTIDAAISFKAVDNYGNVSDALKLGLNGQNGSWTVEESAPVFSEDYFDEQDTELQPVEDSMEPSISWYNKPLKLNVTVNDKDSGLNHISYTLKKDGKAIKTDEPVPEEDGFTFPAKRDDPYVFTDVYEDGIYELHMTAYDNAGNFGSLNDGTGISFNVDTTPPSISDISGKPEAWTTREAVIRFKLTDDTSGVDTDTVAITLNGTPVDIDRSRTDEGIYSFTADRNGSYIVTAEDRALNPFTDTIVVDKIDAEKAVGASYEVDPEVGNGNEAEEGENWYKEKFPAINITKATRTAGRSPVDTFYTLEKWNDGSWGSYISDVKLDEDSSNGPKLNTDGIYRLTVYSWTEAAQNDYETASEKEKKDLENLRNYCKTRLLYVDTTVPGLSSIDFKDIHGGTLAKAINFLSFGNFFNQAIRIEIEVNEEAEPTSGPKYVYYDLSSEQKDDFEPVDTKRAEFSDNGIAYFDISPELFGEDELYIYYYIEDAAGNRSELKKVKGNSSVLWMLEADAPSITMVSPENSIVSPAVYSGIDDKGQGWYKEDVIVKASVSDKSGGIAKAYIELDGPTGKDQVSANEDLTADKVTDLNLETKISNNGTTTFDIYAEDNAYNNVSLNADTAGNPAWAGGNNIEARTIRLDKDDPDIEITSKIYEEGQWIDQVTYDINFKVSDHKEGKEKGVDYSGVDPTNVGTSGKPVSIRVVLVEDEKETPVKVTRLPGEAGDSAKDTYAYFANVDKNGLYKIYAKDYAGNEGSEEFTITWIPTGAGVHTPVDATWLDDSEEQEKIHGYVMYEPAEGNGGLTGYYDTVDQDRELRWYTEFPSSISVTNSTDFVVQSGIDNTDPVVTEYLFINRSVAGPNFDENLYDMKFERVGYSEDAGESSPIPNVVTDIQSIINDDATTYKDGAWVLFVRNVNENTGVKSGLLRIRFLIDTTNPKIDFKALDEGWATEKKVSFTITDPDKAKEDGKSQNGTQSGIDFSTLEIVYKDGNVTENIDSISCDESTGECEFTALKNGSYVVTVKDKAGNPSSSTIYVSNISKDVPELAAISVDPIPGNGEAVNRTDFADANGDNWYALNGEDSTIPEFVLTRPEAGGGEAPVVTYWKLWKGDLGEEPVGYTDALGNGFVFNDKDLEGTDRAIRVSLPENDGTDGQWNIKTWSVSESGVTTLDDPEAPTKGFNVETIFVDNERPEVVSEPVSIEITNEGPIWEALNKFTFGVFFNKELEVAVRINDETSLGYRLHYAITKDSGTIDEQDTTIDLEEDKTTGTATFKLPLGTKGEVKLTATDKAGNVSREQYLTFEGDKVYWQLEQAPPMVVDSNPGNQEDGVDIADLDGIWLVFNEYVELVDGDLIELSVGGNHYTVADEDALRFITSIGPDEGGPLENYTDEPTLENINSRWYVQIPIDSFRASDGSMVELIAGAPHSIIVHEGAFKDASGNVNTESTIFFTAGEKQGDPYIMDMDLELPESSVMSPADFSSDHEDYVILMMDEDMNEDGSALSMDLDMKTFLRDGTYHITRVELTDVYNHVLMDTDALWDPINATEGNISIPAEIIKASENYYLDITVTQYGTSRTYSFFISTSAISAVSEDVGDIGVSVDPDELVESMRAKLEADALKDWKAVIKFRAASIPVTSAGTELEAVIKALEADDIHDSSLGFWPMDLSVTEFHGRTGETETIAKLDNPVTVTITMPEDSVGREVYGIYRYDEATGTAVKVEHTLSTDGKTATIVTDDFSGTYAIVYDDKPASSGTTGDTGGSGGSGGSGGGGGGGGTGGSGTLTVSGTTAYYGGTWVNDGWLFKEADGRIPQNEWLRIDGKIYRFGLDGFMDPDYNGYRYNTDGSLAVALPEGQTARDAVGTWLQDGWRYVISGGNNLSNGWYYLFYQGRFEWYYFNAEGWMLDGWRDLNGETYYLHTVHDWTRGRMYTDWHFIDGKWYYFRTKAEGNEGALVRNQYTITGHFVGADGAWDGNGPAPTESI